MGNKLKIVDTRCLTDADWAKINLVKRAYEAGGMDAFWEELERLEDRSPVTQICVAAAFFPEVIRQAIKDEMAEHGMSIEDWREMIRALESPAGDQ